MAMDPFQLGGQSDLCVQLKSWRGQWVSISEPEDCTNFHTLPKLSPGESYEGQATRCGSKSHERSWDSSQALIACLPERGHSCLLAVKPRPDGKYDLQICAGGLGEGFQGFGQGLFLSFVGRRVGLKGRSGLDTAFAIQFADENRVCFRGGSENLFLSADPQGRIYTGPTRPRRWEWFTMLPRTQPGPQLKSPMPLPVRVSLRGHNGRYLCTSHSTVSALAEVPCCCEEFLVQVGPASPSGAGDVKGSNATLDVWSTISTATEDEILSADTSGGLSIVPRGSARGRENFLVHLTSPKWPRVAILHQNLLGTSSFGQADSSGEGKPTDRKRSPGQSAKSYVGVDFSGLVVSDRRQPHTWEQFTLELVSGSRVFIQGVNGRFMAGAPKSDGSNRAPVNAANLEPSECWEVRSHGDGMYSLVLAPVENGRAETYLFVDDSGRLQQSSEPAVQFPATCSLFFLEPVAQKALALGLGEEKHRNPVKELFAHLSRRGNGGSEGFGEVLKERIVGFSIRTAGKVGGRERYLSVEPNGAVKATRTRVGRTEVFALADVNALAARAEPVAFSCRAAAHSNVNPLQTPPQPPPTNSHERAAARAAEEAAAREARKEVSRQRQQIRAAARALEARASNPKPSPAQLQALCANAIASNAATHLLDAPRCNTPAACLSSWGAGLPQLIAPQSERRKTESAEPKALLDEMLHVLAGAAAPPCCYDGAFPTDTRAGPMRVIPNDVLDRIDDAWGALQPRAHSCKTHVATHRPLAGRARARALRRARGRGFDEGFVCKQCFKDRLTRLDPVVNPTHHRFLEVQQRLRGVNLPGPRALWNPLTVTAVSMVSSLLYFSRGPNGGGSSDSG